MIGRTARADDGPGKDEPGGPDDLGGLPHDEVGGAELSDGSGDGSVDDETSSAEQPEDTSESAERRRAKTMSRKQMVREHRKLRAKGELLEIIDYWRPKTREDCLAMSRPCLYVSCRHHLYLDVNPETGSVKLNFPDKEPWELEETCALDVADRGGITLEEVGAIMNLTRERIRQVEVRGLEKLKQVPEGGIDEYTDWDPYDPSEDF
jgi:hypothetical protein